MTNPDTTRAIGHRLHSQNRDHVFLPKGVVIAAASPFADLFMVGNRGFIDAAWTQYRDDAYVFRPDVETWCDDNHIKYEILAAVVFDQLIHNGETFESYYLEVVLNFSTETDLAMFKLRWL